MADIIQPRTLKGFRDYAPELMIPREYLLAQARQVYRSYGYSPIDTPALEYTEILLGKGGEESDKLIYRFMDHGGRDVALRFDLTVPFARFAALHVAKAGTPFKRYHMGPVWRGENTAHGRYREFWQCDFDTIGTTSNGADVEVALVIHDLMRALGLERFRIHVNNRLVLNGFLEQLGLAAGTKPVLIALDKLAKLGPDRVLQELTEKAGASREQAGRVLALAALRGSNREILDQLQTDFGGHARTAEGIVHLRQLLEVAATSGVPEDCLAIDLSIARGLEYYTGTVYETFLRDLPGIGSVCSGGRYDNLAGMYTKQRLPGVGASLGLDRLVAALEELNLLQKTATPAPVLVIQFTAEALGHYQRIGRLLRQAGIGAEVYPDARKIGQQLQYAERRGHRLALIGGPEELARGVWKVKDLSRREEVTAPEGQMVELVRGLLAGGRQGG